MNNCCNCDEKKAGCPWQVALWILAVLGVSAGIIGIAYTVYRFCTPDYLDDFDLDDLDDEDKAEEAVEVPLTEE